MPGSSVLCTDPAGQSCRLVVDQVTVRLKIRVASVLGAALVVDQQVRRAQKRRRPGDDERVELPLIRHPTTTFEAICRPLAGVPPKTMRRPREVASTVRFLLRGCCGKESTCLRRCSPVQWHR